MKVTKGVEIKMTEIINEELYAFRTSEGSILFKGYELDTYMIGLIKALKITDPEAYKRRVIKKN